MNRYNMELDKITVPDNTVDALMRRAAVPRRKKTGWLRPAIVASCLVVAAVIPVAAAMRGKPLIAHRKVAQLPEFLLESEEKLVGGYLVENEETVSIEMFSEELQDYTAQLDTTDEKRNQGYLPFENWEQAEDYIGYDILNNAVLQNAQAGSRQVFSENGEPIVDAPGVVRLGIASWGLNVMEVEASYLLNGVSVRVAATLHTRDGFGQISIPSYEGEGEIKSVETYVTAGKQESAIVQIAYPQYGDWWVRGFIKSNRAIVEIDIISEDAENAVAIVKQVMDGFQ